MVWWSSDFSHLRKTNRKPCPETGGFSVRLVKTPSYKKNIGFARIRNHRIFAEGFCNQAMATISNSELSPPDRIVVSLSPLGAAGSAFKIRELMALKLKKECQVVVDVLDAWPEAFYRILPKFCRKALGSLIFSRWHRIAKQAYKEADKISAVGQGYLELANSYLSPENRPQKPMHLCYHGVDLDRFPVSKKHEDKPEGIHPFKAVYLGAMGSGYDLMVLIKVAAKWKVEGRFPWQIHFAGTGPLIGKLQKESKRLGLSTEFKTAKDGVSTNTHKDSDRVVFHGQLKREAVDQLLLSADVGIVPNRPDSLVVCPNKAGEYAAAGLPMISCLNSEFNELLKEWDCGVEYTENDPESLETAFAKYSDAPRTLFEQSRQASKMAETLFDRRVTYPQFVDYILN